MGNIFQIRPDWAQFNISSDFKSIILLTVSGFYFANQKTSKKIIILL
jgi:hypothetical protein